MASAGGDPAILPAVLLLRPPDPSFSALLRERFLLLDLFASGEPLPAFLAAAATENPRAAIVVGGGSVRVDASFLDAVPSLRCIVSTAAGVDHVDLAECARRGFAVANSGEVFSTDVADYAVGLLLDVLRQLSAAGRYVRRGSWPVQGDYPLGSKTLNQMIPEGVAALGGKHVGIIGLGNIGSRIAKRLEAFGCIIHYNSTRPKDETEGFGLLQATRHIVNKDVLGALGKDCVVINIGRGANVDEAELVMALKEGKIAGAGLDVFEHEPKVPADLFAMDNVVLSHHSAVFTEDSRSDLRTRTIGNLEAFFSSQPLLTPVHADSLVQ